MDKKIEAAVMSAQDWENLRLQLRTLVDIYCEMNNDIVKIKTSLKSIVKHLRKQERELSKKEIPPKGLVGKRPKSTLVS